MSIIKVLLQIWFASELNWFVKALEQYLKNIYYGYKLVLEHTKY